ncbi:uncharacterized protein N7496_012208 [Penicillium cataractarum]|uniref:Uncharacterized protein n=1 Tax=Penicillium cataractarum TaxID=2100454 RepID=A0A9W9R7G4_9EURO|nr:uncharacterized protein N7496_012208 [Penicillium cataractarum]KAJ5354996.1 hypothetical protein N7496_012208 [Penicillium cataractarum]
MSSKERGETAPPSSKYNICPDSTWTLEKLANVDNITSLQLVIDLGVEIAVYGHAALFYAIYRGHQDMSNFSFSTARIHIYPLLLDNGVRPDSQDLELAVKMNSEEAVALLEKFSYDDLPERMRLVQFTRQREAERLGDPGFYRLDWDHWRAGPRLRFGRMGDN